MFVGRLLQCACRQKKRGFPWLQESQEQGSEQRLLEALPGILDFISGAGVRTEAAEARLGTVGSAAQLRRSGLDLARSRTSSSSSDKEAGVDNFTHLPGHVPSNANRCVGRTPLSMLTRYQRTWSDIAAGRLAMLNFPG